MDSQALVYKCRNCDSQKIVKNGHHASGSQQYWCKDCGKRGVLEPKRGYTEAQKEQILSAYSERSSMRGVQRTFGVSRPTLASWLKKDEANPKLEETLLPAEPDDVLEADKMWSFVQEGWNKRWLWTVMCRRTRQIVAFVIGDRSEATCRKLWEQIPPAYRDSKSRDGSSSSVITYHLLLDHYPQAYLGALRALADHRYIHKRYTRSLELLERALRVENLRVRPPCIKV